MPEEFGTVYGRTAGDGDAEGELNRREGVGNGSDDIWNEGGGVGRNSGSMLPIFWRKA